MKIPIKVRCTPVFHKFWRYRVRPQGWGQLENIYICSKCKEWSSYKIGFNQVCPKKNRRKRDRRKAA